MRLGFFGALALGTVAVLLFASPTPSRAEGQGPAAAGARTKVAAERAAYRRAHRPYDGAPPVIPHAVRALGRQDCLKCHREGMEMVEPGPQQVSPKSPHPQFTNCQQCHLEIMDKAGTPAVRSAPSNSFVGLRHNETGSRAYPGAPPTMPHPVWMRESCASCHGKSGGSPLRTPHPDRVNCQQCHIAAKEPAAAPFVPNSFGSETR